MNSGRFGWERNKTDPAYYRKHVRSLVFLLFLAALLVMSVLVSLWAGSYDTPTDQLILGIFGLAEDEKINIVVRNVRLPRICTAVIAGAGLGVTGCILQAVLHNPLASASTLGVSQGAGFGAAFAIMILGIQAAGSGSFTISACAFAGSMAVALVILGLSRFCRITPETMVLAGVSISAMFSGATTLLQYFADETQLATLLFWTFGDLGGAGWDEIRKMSLTVALATFWFLLHRWDFNALLSGRETAVSLGINIRRLVLVNMLICCYTASSIISKIGLVSFIGLIAPHMVRMVVGNNHIYLIPGSVLAGASLLLFGDLLSRILLSPVVLPIGAITSFLGAPLFLYLLFKGRDKTC